MMKRVIIIGCPGSGKTTFAKKLHDKTSLPLYHLDAIWHKPDKFHITREEFDARMSQILAEGSWIIDGNYQRTLERRMSACDTVFLFDIPTDLCIEGATSRLGTQRYDMPWIDTTLDHKLKNEIESFPSKNLPTIYDLIDKYKGTKNIVVFKSREESDRFIEKI